MSSSSVLTIGETVDQIVCALRDYIEATYHIGNPSLVAQRRELLQEEGVLFRRPYIESTPRYLLGCRFEELSMPEPARLLIAQLTCSTDSTTKLLHDPPYVHQATSLQETLTNKRSIVVTTGTGSGKTESFLLPILGRLATEASDCPASFSAAAVRAILLYPMNALVNDQLGRLRLLFGDQRVVSAFKDWAGRPARFARYTSRTLYPGVRTAKKDQARLKSIRSFYVTLLEDANDDSSPKKQVAATKLIESLKARGKWPCKPDLLAWYGSPGDRWANQEGEFLRAVMMPDDSELFTRHEVLEHPPDILVTNYSMLEYMLMRPLERPVFDATRRWLSANPEERLMLVVDEAHLYRGSAGAEVALLLRRLRSRLDIPPERLQVICTSASFSDEAYSGEFAAGLTGKKASDFVTIRGNLALRPHAGTGTKEDAENLTRVDLATFYNEAEEHRRAEAVAGFLDYRGVQNSGSLAACLYEALSDFPPMSRLVNLTMEEAKPVHELSGLLFPSAPPDMADRATTALIALGSVARREESEPGLLPCRVHSFFRGLPGLWACVNPDCPSAAAYQDTPIGSLFSQPHDVCDCCGSRVFELYTCRNCGSAYLRAYTDNLETPSFLWNEPGGGFQSVGGPVKELLPLDLLLEAPGNHVSVEPADLDLITGRLNPARLGEQNRQVFLRLNRCSSDDGDGDEDDGTGAAGGEFIPCGACGQRAAYGRSSVQDHQTKGDQPFQALVARQLEVQPPSPRPFTDFAPLRGRKVLAFSDSRQTAARLAPNLQTYSMQDVLRPLILRGWRELDEHQLVTSLLSLEDLHLSVLIGAHLLQVRLRPELKSGESFHALVEVSSALKRGALDRPDQLLTLLVTLRSESVPQSLLRGIVTTIADRYYGLPSLALASLRETTPLAGRFSELPAIPDAADTEEKRKALIRAWIAQWSGRTAGIWFQNMTPSWHQTRGGVRTHSGKFAALDRWLGGREAKRVFEREWLPQLLEWFCESLAPSKYRMKASNLALQVDGSWGYCQSCRTTQRPFPGSSKCVNCGADAVGVIDPETDPVFAARKGYYRASSMRALADPPASPMSIIAAEHTAQLNAAQSDEVFSKAEEHELLFQDVDLGVTAAGERPRTAIDVLSCTTTMEVGIDIGTLSGVALRNMPPSRASYQQRSGRAGRRGNAVATVVAFGSADSHDEHYFAEPDAMIRGEVDDPVLTLDNVEIARRHVTAFLFQKYHESRLPDIEPSEQPQLFEVLGTVEAFRDPSSPLNRGDFEVWLRESKEDLGAAIDAWLPEEIDEDDRNHLLAVLIEETLMAVDSAIDDGQPVVHAPEAIVVDGGSEDAIVVEAPAEEGEEHADPRRASENLLDRLLYKGVLPRYAFPTDVVSFHVFNKEESTRFRPAFQYAPSQGLPVALTQYAPGKRVWIDGREWISGALYSPMSDDRYRAWQNKRIYFECQICHYAKTETQDEAARGEVRDCPACGAESSFGKAKNWIRPPGFAHRQNIEEETSSDDQPVSSYATRAKLVAPGPSDEAKWRGIGPRLREYYDRTHLLVTNTGPRGEGYTYCTKCGLIEPTAVPTSALTGIHPKPYPDDRNPSCEGGGTTKGLVLGTDFISDVLLISLKVEPPLTLRPGFLATDVALRTLSEAITIAATKHLEIEPGELQAEYRPALTAGGREGLEAEIYLYDTLAGGAGFARRVAEMGGVVFEDAIDLLESCPAECDRSCYRCLRSFKNRFEHSLLDRHLGASLLRYVVHGEQPELSTERIDSATDRLYADLSRHGLENIEMTRRAMVDLPGLGEVEAPILVSSGASMFIVGVHGPLTPDHPADPSLRDAKEFGAGIPVLLADELVVARNLPRASHSIIASLS